MYGLKMGLVSSWIVFWGGVVLLGVGDLWIMDWI